MNARVLISLVAVYASAGFAQGTIAFKNFDAATGLNAPVFRILDFQETMVPLSGTNYIAELLAGPSPFNDNMQTVAATSFLSGAQAGYFDGAAQSIPGVPSGSNAIIEIRVWVWSAQAPSYAAAQTLNLPGTWGQFDLFTVTTGTSNAPATLSPLRAFWLNDGWPLDSTNVPAIFANYNRVNGMVEVSYLGHLQVSSDLVHWTDDLQSSFGEAGANTGIKSFPMDQGFQYFRTRRQPWITPP